MYAAGREHPYREPCRSVLERAGAGDLTGEASVELVQELAQVMLRRVGSRRDVVRRVGEAAELCRLHAFEPADLPLALSLLEQHDRLDPRDAVFAATAINRDVPVILSPDRAFDGIRGLRRVDPLDHAAVAAL